MANIQNLPDLRPSLLLDFANSRMVDPRVAVTRPNAATRWDAAGLLETVPAGVLRIDHDPATGNCLGIRREEARTNLRTNSRQPTASTGTVLGTSTAIAPDGLAVTSIEDDPATSGEHYVNDLAVAVTTGQTFVQSVFVKAMPGAERQVVLRVAGSVAGNQSLAFNVSDTACSATSAPSYPYGIQKCLNGWWRIWISYTAASDVPAATFRVQLYKNNASVYQGEAGKGLFLFGRQVEVGDSVSSYIPAGASAATRAAESIWMPVSAMVEGTLLVTCAPTDPVTASGNRSHLSLSDGSSSNFARLNITGAGSLTSSVTKNGAHGYGGTLGLFQAGTTLKRALAFSNADAKHCTNGVLGAPSDSSYQGANSMNQLWLGSLNGSQGFNGTLARVAVYSKRLSDAQLQRLTS